MDNLLIYGAIIIITILIIWFDIPLDDFIKLIEEINKTSEAFNKIPTNSTNIN